MSANLRRSRDAAYLAHLYRGFPGGNVALQGDQWSQSSKEQFQNTKGRKRPATAWKPIFLCPSLQVFQELGTSLRWLRSEALTMTAVRYAWRRASNQLWNVGVESKGKAILHCRYGTLPDRMITVSATYCKEGNDPLWPV